MVLKGESVIGIDRMRHELLHVLGQHVDLQVHGVARRSARRASCAQGLGDERDGEARVVHRRPRSATRRRPRSSPSRPRSAAGPRRRRSGPRARSPPRRDRLDRARRRRRGPARCGRPGGRRRAAAARGSPRRRRRARQRGAAQRLGHHVGAEARPVARPWRSGRRRSRRPSRPRRAPAPRGVSDAQPSVRERRDRARGLDEPGEHSPLPQPRGDQHVVVDALDLGVHRARARRRSSRRPAPRPPPCVAAAERASGATNMRASSISPASRKTPARCGPPSSSSDWMSREPSSSSAAPTRAASFWPRSPRSPRPRRCAGASVAVRLAAREQTTITGDLAGAAHQLASRAAGWPRSRTPPAAAGAPTPSTRAVSSGSSAQRGVDAHGHGVALGAPAVGAGAAGLAGDPLRVAGARWRPCRRASSPT